MRVGVRTYGWYGDTVLNLIFPDRWNVSVQRMAGHSAPSLTKDQIRRRVAKPVGSRTLRDLAKDRMECVIIVDDLTRPTKASQILPSILQELHDAGLENDHIRFVMALGAHHWMRLDDIRKKLGNDIPEQYNVFNHNVYENHVFIGKTSRGTPVHVNREVMKCDLKIGIGSIIPHKSYCFGGGAKIVLPGVASIDTIHRNHSLHAGESSQIEDSAKRLDAEEAARLVGLDFIANALINPDRDCCELICGDPVEAHRVGVSVARKHYLTSAVKADVVVANGYPLESAAYKVLDMIGGLSEGSEDRIILLHTPEGSRGHYYNGRFGTNFGGKGWKPEKYLSSSCDESTYVVAPHCSLAERQYIAPSACWVRSWNDVLRRLKAKYRGSRVNIAVYPYAPIQVSCEDTCN